MEIAKTPFHRPSISETAEVSAKMAQNDQLIQDIDLQIRQLMQERFRLYQQNATYKSILAPVRRLTFDVLGHIFYYYTVINEEDPWILAHVSRTWRATAFGTPCLWAGLHLELNPETTDLPSSRRIGGKEYCATIKQLELALRRPSSNLLDIKLVSPITIPTIVRAHIPTMLHIISHRMNRWRSLEVDGAISHLPGLNRQPLENLERLVMKTKDKSLLPLIKQSATGLTSFTNTLLGLEEFEGAVWWPTLRHLDLTIIPIDTNAVPQTPLLRTILAETEQLETLVLDFHQMQPESVPLAELPNLRRLELYDIPALLPFECPNLTHLQISVGKGRPMTSAAPLPTPSKRIDLPYLTHLTFQHPNLAALSAINAPNLIELVISPQVRIIAPQYNDNALRTIWSVEKRDGAGMLRPKILRLEDMHVSAETIQAVLRFIEGLEMLTIKWLRTDHAALLKLLSASVPARSSSQTTVQSAKPSTPPPTRRLLLCPALQQFALYDSSTLRSDDTRAMQASLEEIVKVRRDLDCPIKGVVCRWPNGNLMKEYKI